MIEQILFPADKAVQPEPVPIGSETTVVATAPFTPVIQPLEVNKSNDWSANTCPPPPPQNRLVYFSVYQYNKCINASEIYSWSVKDVLMEDSSEQIFVVFFYWTDGLHNIVIMHFLYKWL